MVEARRSLGEVSAEVNLARRLLRKYQLSPPIDVESLVRDRAHLSFASIPFANVDGISIHIKVSGRTPRVVVNSRNPLTRQRFTLAHELGHLIIPWHTGTIIDHATEDLQMAVDDYWQIEAEANAFAAELLMPSEWIERLLQKEEDLGTVHATIFSQCQTSPLSAAINLARLLPQNVVFAFERDGQVEFSGRTERTTAPRLVLGDPFPKDAYDYAAAHYETSWKGRSFHWWRLPSEIVLSSSDPRGWREILDEILLDIGTAKKDFVREKQSINGVVAYANGRLKNTGNYTVAALASASIQRFKDRKVYAAFVDHPKFKDFVFRRAEELVASSK